MRLGTRLLLLLLPTVTFIMMVYAYWALTEREDTLAPEARQEVQAYANALGLAFDLALRDARREDVQALLNEVNRAPALYGILIYDSTGTRTIVSDPLQTPAPAPTSILAQVLATGATASFERDIEGQRVYSALRALRSPSGHVTGALEVAQPLSSIEAEKAAVRRRFMLNTVTLLGALTLVTLWLVRRVVAAPMEQLVTAARALGSGELAHRISEDPAGGELSELAHEFNGMAHSLEVARVVVARDAEERLALERRLREAERMAVIGTMAAGLAHEIAAPLNVISGRAELMLRREPTSPVHERNLRIIVEQIGRITTIVRNLLDFAKRRELRMRSLDFNAVIDDVLEFLDAELVRAGVTVVRGGDGAVWVRGDPDLLHQVLVNLVLNAVQAMEGTNGSRVLSIRASGAPVDEGGGDIGGAILEVEDSGPGIPLEVLPSIFEPFFTTKPRGTGLGLVVARSIVEEHGGRLEARTGLFGATLRVSIPSQKPLSVAGTNA